MRKQFAILVGLAWAGGVAFATPGAEAANYIVTDQTSFNAFLAGVGGTGTWSSFSSTGSVTSGTLPAGSTATFAGATTLRPQTGTFTNDGTITINSTGRGFYGAGTFVNQGSMQILAADNPENYTSIVNSGSFSTAITFGNYGTFTNLCGGTVTGTIIGTAPVQNCPTYVVIDQPSFNAFLSGTGSNGFWSPSQSTGSVTSGIIPAGVTVTFAGGATFRPQTGTFTNLGTLIINSTGRGFYGAGTFVNQGSTQILAANSPENYASIVNGGSFTTAITFGNYATFTNQCNATVTGSIIGNAPVTDCPTPTKATTWGQVKARYNN